MKGVQCYELFRGIALKIHTFSFFIFFIFIHLFMIRVSVGCMVSMSTQLLFLFSSRQVAYKDEVIN